MKTTLIQKYLLPLITIFIAGNVMAQLPDGFDIKAAYQQAQQKGIIASDIKGYVQFLHDDYLSHKNLTQPLTNGSTQNTNNGINHSIHSSNHSNAAMQVRDLGTIYLNGNSPAGKPGAPAPPNTPQNAYCPNAGFEQLTFANWTGGYGTVSMGPAGSGFPTYTQTSPTIMNGAGNNVSLVNTINYHTIMTTPATNSVYPNCVGWDSIACKVVGTQTVSEIPVVNPLGGPASVRLNGAEANYRASKINYLMTLNPNNKNFSVSYALVLYSGGHSAEEQPYFSVKVTDQNGALVPGCSVYTVTINSAMTNSTSPFYDPSWTESVIGGFGFSTDIYYRKWQTFAFDFTNYPSITSVNVEFYVGGCAQGGHWGYAYVDAQCSQGGAVASFCAGSNTSVLTAPPGYSTYQWTGPGGPISISNGGNTGTATISPVTAGQVFTCNVTAPNGCSSAFTTTVSITTVSITAVGSTPSCPTGTSGTGNVSATGSSLGYSYQWLNSLGAVVSTSQTATGLSPGTYSIVVSSPMCGSQTATVAVGISPPTFYSLSAPYCGAVAWITKAGGSNYKWYTATPLAIIPGATTPTLTVNSPVNGAQYYLSYTTASGCKDSIKYTLTQTPGGSIYVSNIKSICPGNSNSYAVVNLQTGAPPVYSYTVTGPAGYNSTLNNTNSIKDSVINLSIGTYSTTVFDGQCLYNTTFTVSPFVFTYTLTPPSSTICSSGGTPLTVDFGNFVTNTCSTDPQVCLTGNPTNLFSGPFTQNSGYDYPTPYGNFYTYERAQYLLRQSDLNAAGINAGKISSLAFNVLNVNGGITSYPNFNIKMGCTSLASLPNVSSGTGQSFIGGLSTVYSNANQPIATGWVTHNFNQAYVWDGASNIIIEVCFGMNTPYTYIQNATVELKQLPYVASWYHVEDTSPVCGGTQPADNGWGGSLFNGEYMVPNMKLGYCGGQNPSAFTYTWTPSTGLSSTNTYTTFATPASTTVYTVQVNPIGQTNCMQAQTATVNIVNPASPTITPVSPKCTNASAITLTVNPAGGTWFGSGISSAGVLTPSLATPGNNTYTYSIGSGTCAAIGNTTISIEQFIPSTITSTLNAQCLTNAPLPLPATTSTLGTWTGPGVSGSNFSPALAGVGVHTLTYSTQSNPTASLCPSASTSTVTVSTITQPTIAAAGPYCDNMSPQTMTVNPVGGGTGTWGASAGTSVTPTGIFDPAASFVGMNAISYTLTNGPCVATASSTVQVVHFVSAALSSGAGPFCNTNPAFNLQTLPINPGGLWTGTGVSGNNFDPSVANVGNHVLTYSTTSVPIASLCPAASNITVTVNSITQPTITPAGPYCDNAGIKSMSVTPAGGTWGTSTPGTAIASNGDFNPAASILGNNTVTYTLTSGPCMAFASQNVQVVHYVDPAISGTGPFCIYAPATDLQALAQNAGGVWSGMGVTGTMFSPAAAGAGTITVTYSTNPVPFVAGLCSDFKTISIVVNATPVIVPLANKYEDCNPFTTTFYTPNANTGTLIWNFGDNSQPVSSLAPAHTYTTPGTYTVTTTYTNNVGCAVSSTVTTEITVNAVPVADFSPSLDVTTVVDGEILFTNLTSDLNNNTYAWDFGGIGGSSNVNPTFLFTNSGEYFVTLHATSNKGCIDDQVKKITVNPDVVLYVPNSFTPNGDGLNDEFQIFLPPTGVDYSTFSLTIFDRWGSVIYKSNDVFKFWKGSINNSGEIVKQDTYVYKISFKDEKKKYYEKLGYITLLAK